jgi:hypothetical protein
VRHDLRLPEVLVSRANRFRAPQGGCGDDDVVRRIGGNDGRSRSGRKTHDERPGFDVRDVLRNLCVGEACKRLNRG